MSSSSDTALPLPSVVVDEPCLAASHSCGAAQDLTWLMHRAANRLRLEFDRIARGVGLGDVREWVVLTALSEDSTRTQLELGRLIGVDKTTLMGVLDRMEQRELIVRTADPNDRRVRIPQATPTGIALQSEVARRRDDLEQSLLAGVPPVDQQRLRELLSTIAGL